jgi:hypothetical protein
MTPGFGQFNANMAPPAPSQNKDVSPANVFAQMKSGTFGDDSAPQPAGKHRYLLDTLSSNVPCAGTYDALRPQPTGWGGGYQNGNGYGYGR